MAGAGVGIGGATGGVNAGRSGGVATAHTPAPGGKTPTGGYNTNPLRVLTQQQIVNQATKNITTAYAPSYAEFNQQSAEARAINDKQSADNQYYLTWLNAKSQELQAHQDAANASLTNLASGLTTQQNQLYQQQNSLGFGGANADLLHGTQLGNNQLINAQAMGAAQTAGNENNLIGAATANDLATIGAGQTKDNSDLNTEMQKIADSRLALQGKEGVDLANEIMRLQGVNIQVAQKNFEDRLAGQRLGIQAANTSSEINSRNIGNSIKQENAATARMRANEYVTHTTNADRIAQGRLTLDINKFHTTGTALPLASQNSVYKYIAKAESQITQLTSLGGLTPQHAYQLLKDGGTVDLPVYVNGRPAVGSNGQPKYSRQHFTPYGQGSGNYWTILLNAAYNLHTTGKLSPGDVSALKTIGIGNPGSRYAVVPPNSPGATVQNTGQAGGL